MFMYLLQQVSKPSGDVSVALGYGADGTVAWVENGTGDRWSFSDSDDEAEGTYHPAQGWRAGGPDLIATNTARAYTVTGNGGIPADGVQAVVLDVEASSFGHGELQMYPTGSDPGLQPMAFMPGYRSTTVTVAVGDDGKVNVRNTGTDAQVTVDVVGWYAESGTEGGSVFVPLPTERVYDSRDPGNGALGAGEARAVQVTGQGGVPADGVTAVVFDLEMVSASALTDLVTYASGESRPPISTGVTAGGIVDNLQVAEVGDDGKVMVHNSAGSVHVLVDIVGYFADPDVHSGDVYRPLTPSERLLDTRSPGSQWSTPWPAGTRQVRVAGEGGVPVRGVTGVVGEVQSIGPASTHTMVSTLFGQAANGTTYVGQQGASVGNALYVGLDNAGRFDLASNLATDVVIDVFGYFTPVPRTVFAEGPDGDTVEYRYDEFGRMTGRIDAEGGEKAHVYNDEGFLAYSQEGEGVRHTYSYDDEGRVLEERVSQRGWNWDYSDNELVDLWSTSTYYGYVDEPANPARDGKLAWVADGRSEGRDDTSYRTTYTYDADGRPLTVAGPALAAAPGGAGVDKAYTTGTEPAVGGGTMPAGLVLTQTDAQGRVTTFAYDQLGNLREATAPAGARTLYTYDELGRAVTVTEESDAFPAGVTTTRVHDDLGRVVRETGPDVTNVVTSTTTSGVAETTYTPDGEPERATVTDAGSGESRWSEATYDAAGRVTSTLDSAGRATGRTYDGAGNLVSETGIDGLTVTHAYDGRGLRTSSTAQDVVDDPVDAPGQSRDVVLAAYEYDGAGRRVAEVDAAGRRTDYIWRADGEVEATLATNVEGTDPDTGLPTGAERTVLVGAARRDAAGNPTTSYAPTDVAEAFDFSEPLDGTWAVTGTASVVDGELHWDTDGLAMRPGPTDGSVTLTVGSGPSSGLRFRQADADTYNEVVWGNGPGGGLMSINRVTDGNKTALAGGVMPALAEGDRVEVVFAGDRVVVLANGAVVLTAIDTVPAAGSDVGVFAYTGNSAEALRVDTFGRTEHSYDAYGRLVLSHADPGGAGLVTTYERDPGGRPTAVTLSGADGSGPVTRTEYGYDAAGNPAWAEVTVDASTVLRSETTYDDRGLLVTEVSPSGARTDHAYDEVGRLVSTTGPARTVERYGQPAQPDARPVTQYGYDAFGDQTHQKDAAGRVTTIDFDDRGLPVEATLPDYQPPGGGDPIARATSTTYDDAGRPLTVTGLDGEATTHTYNDLGLQVARTDPAVGAAPAGVWRTTYDDLGRPVEQRDPTGAVTRPRWDDFGRQAGLEEVVRQPALTSHVSAATYGNAGGQVRARSAAGVVTTSRYDVAGRLLAEADADGNETTYGYDTLGRVYEVTGPDGRRTTTTYDLAGRVTAEDAYAPDDTHLGTSTYSWDADGNLVEARSPRGVAEGFGVTSTYDPAGQLISRTTPVAPGQSITETYGYDELGQPTRYTDGNSNTTWQTYNAMGLPEDTIRPPAGPHTADADRLWRTTYDAAGRPVEQHAPGGVTVTAGYDELGRPNQQAGTGADATTETITFGYDLAGRRTSAATPTGAQSFTYDDRGLLLGATGHAGDSSFAYDPDGRLTHRNDAAGTLDVTYDNRGLPATATTSLAGTATYSFGPAGRLTGIHYGNGTTRTYTHDGWGRVGQDHLTTGTDLLYGLDYGYDLDGNITTKAISGTGVPAAGTNTYTYDRAGRITAWTGPAGTTEAYSWDAASNRTQAGAVTATYDAQNRITAQAGPGGATTTYTWDANGTLATRDTTAGALQAVLVVDDPAAPTADDTALQAQLVGTHSAGVTLTDGTQAAPAGTDVVVVSPSVPAAQLAGLYADAVVPIVSLAPATWQDTGLTDTAPTPVGDLDGHVADDTHDLAAGLTGDNALLTPPPPAPNAADTTGNDADTPNTTDAEPADTTGIDAAGIDAAGGAGEEPTAAGADGPGTGEGTEAGADTGGGTGTGDGPDNAAAAEAAAQGTDDTAPGPDATADSDTGGDTTGDTSGEGAEGGDTSGEGEGDQAEPGGPGATSPTGGEAPAGAAPTPAEASGGGEVMVLASGTGGLVTAAPGSLGAGATTVWETTGGDTLIAAWDTGDATAGGTAPAPRAAIGLEAGSLARLTTDGTAVIDAAIDWATAGGDQAGLWEFQFDAYEQLRQVTGPDPATTNNYAYDALGRRLDSPTGTLAYAGTNIRPAADGAHRYQPAPAGVTEGPRDFRTRNPLGFLTEARELGVKETSNVYSRVQGRSGERSHRDVSADRRGRPRTELERANPT